jgi:uncharacterized membrane protein (UPF0127 family)
MGKGAAGNAALLLEPCNSIHTCFMRFEIDAVFLDEAGVVVKIYNNIKPWRFILPVKNSRATLELAQGLAGKLGIKEKDVITFK